LLLCLVTACNKNQDILVREDLNEGDEFYHASKTLYRPELMLDYSRHLPEYLELAGLKSKQVDNLKANLGRVLFYDTALSKDGTVSCASCHKQNQAFGDNSLKSRGVDGLFSKRHSMPLTNVASMVAHYTDVKGTLAPLLWDTRAASVADLSRMAFTSPNEMGMTMDQVVEKVKNQAYYPYVWKQTFGDFKVTEDKILDCISEFVGAMGSHDSKLDKALIKAEGNLDIPASYTISYDTIIRSLYYGSVILGFSDTVITQKIKKEGGLDYLGMDENLGRNIFVNNCTKCHSAIRPFQEVLMACNGLDLEYQDKGRALYTGKSTDVGVFKSPSLRNIALTAPYMHDGRFKTLEEVVKFYSEGVKPHANLHPLLLGKDGTPGFKLSAVEQKQLIAFLHTLTDNSITKDTRFSSPFK
jgi:cytochrome c peroxidase